MDKIIMKNMSFYGYHGVLPEENRLGQKFFVDVILYLDLKKAATLDLLSHTVNYALAYDIVKASVETKQFKLVEALAEDIAQSLLSHFAVVDELSVAIRKPEAPVNAIFDYFGVEILRGKK